MFKLSYALRNERIPITVEVMDILGKIVHTEEWLREVERRGWEPDYLDSAESRKFLDRQNEELKGLIADLGLAQ